MTDHLGNVLTTVLDRKTGQGANGVGTLYTHWAADVPSVTDYYPFGMMMPGRFKVAGDSSKFRFGFNGVEKTDEVAAVGNWHTAKFGEYNPRTATRANPDPKLNLSMSVYAMFSGDPIRYADPLLDSPVALTTDRLREMARENSFGGTGINFNRAVGKAFEGVGLASQGVAENGGHFPSAERSRFTAGRHTYTIPDGVRAVTETRFGFLGNTTTTYPNSSLFEIKAVTGMLRLSSSSYQIRGEMDAVRNSAAGRMGRGTMTFVTTANTIIGPDILQYARANRINLYQVFAIEETDNNSIRFTPPIPLVSPSHYRNNINLTPVLRAGDLSRSYFIRPGGAPDNPGNPDPEIVE